MPCDRCTVIDDTYNASPDSMRASIHVLSSMENVKGRRIAALSDMLELGEDEKEYHYEVGKYIASQDIDELVVFGELSRELLRGAADGKPGALRLTQVEDRDAMTAYLLETLQPEDVVLLKASNGMKLSEVAKAIIG